MDYEMIGTDIVVRTEGFSLADTLDCGQCFRWERQEDGSFLGIVGNRCQKISQNGRKLTFYECGEREFTSFWENYFDFSTDYQGVKKMLSQDKTLRDAIHIAGGIHILRQDPWEMICSFIISQNNHIPRIKGIISRLCENFGTPLPGGGYSFPTAQALASLELEALAPLRAGFRGKYLLDAARKVASNEVDFEKIRHGDLKTGEEELRKIYGVGTKVAQCILLYGFYRTEAFPVDVWIKKVLKNYYPEGFPYLHNPCAGIAQQYLFHYIRLMEKNRETPASLSKRSDF